MDDAQFSPGPGTVTTSAQGTPPAQGTPTRARARARTWVLPTGIAALGLATVLPIYAWIAVLQSHDRSAAALAMPTMGLNHMSVFWAVPVLQASGLAALLWSYLGVTLGLTESGRTVRWLPLRRRDLDRLHRYISLLVIGLIIVHVIATAFDAMGDNFMTALVPQQANWGAARWAYDLGIFAFYLSLLLGPSYYLRRFIGARTWRFAHRFVIIVYILAVWHTLIIGADVQHYGWMRPALWLAQLPLLALLCYRVISPAARSRSTRATATRYFVALVSAAAAAAIVVIMATGHYDTVVHSIQ
jgi:methionine sulfoxide reductase heme-binding subunit